MTTSASSIEEYALIIFTAALNSQETALCAGDYHAGQTPEDIMLEWQEHVDRKIDQPHGDDGAADHPVELAWMRVLSILSEASRRALREYQAANPQP